MCYERLIINYNSEREEELISGPNIFHFHSRTLRCDRQRREALGWIREYMLVYDRCMIYWYILDQKGIRHTTTSLINIRQEEVRRVDREIYREKRECFI